MITGGDGTAQQQGKRIALTARFTQAQQERRSAGLIELIWSWARVASCLGLLVIYLSATVISSWIVAGMCASAVLFVVAIILHTRIRQRRIALDRRIVVLSEGLARLGGHLVLTRSGSRPAPPTNVTASLPAAFDDGEVWPLTDQERDDLDVYAAPVGLFGLLNRTSTALGARRLDVILNHPCLQAERILERQAAVRWLDEQVDARMRIMAATVGQREHNAALDTLVAAMQHAGPVRCPWPGARWLRAWGLISGLLIIYGVIQISTGKPAWLLTGPAAINLLIYARLRSVLSNFMAAWGETGPIVAAWIEVLRQGTQELPAQGLLGVLRDRLVRASAPRVAPRLHRWLQWLNIGGAIQGLMNMLFLYDLQIAQVVLPLIARHRSELMDGLSATTELDALCSLACFAYEQPVSAFPEFAPDATLAVQAGEHPLIAPEQVQPNDVVLNSATRVWVITGSNMSGKSTFLRMVGINVLLAQIGSAVTARQMRLCPMRLLTDVRARDNLARSESYYLAEVRQLRRMILPPSGSNTLLGLIDEPFRGTNSEEQAAASMAVVQHLIASEQLFLVATHERLLTSLGRDNAAANFHFREALDGQEMVFDYQLRPGPAVTRNAIRILQREGYPADLVDRAAKLMGKPDE